MRQFLRERVRRGFHRLGYEVTQFRPLEQEEVDLYREVGPYTMTSHEAVYALSQAVRYVVSSEIPGAIVECGVWRGGSMMAVARTLLDLGRTDRDLYLLDTFEGMSEPTDKDVQWTGRPARALLARESKESFLWAEASLDQVQRAMRSVSYPDERVHFVKGKVEDTIPDQAPDRIALLRLDTDWYESTKHELVHLYPRLAPGGVLILDDYGYWRGAQEATDEYFREHGPAPLLVRIDDEGRRVAVKPNAGRLA